MRLTWKKNALADLREIAEFISTDSPPAARRVVAAIRRETGQLTKRPELGRFGKIEGTRELVICRHPYVVLYEVGKADVLILAVIHSSRRWPSEISR